MTNSIPFSSSELARLHRRVDTPALLILKPRLQSNILLVQKIADDNRVQLRSHIKTHKSVDIALMQLQKSASGITTAKRSEAEVMMEAMFLSCPTMPVQLPICIRTTILLKRI